MMAVQFDKRLIVRAGAAPVVGHGNRAMLQEGRCRHGRILSGAAGRRNGKQNIEQRRSATGERAFERNQAALGDDAAIGAAAVRQPGARDDREPGW
jgi:hypothetical protein